MGRPTPAKVGQSAREAAAHVLSLQNLAEQLGFPRSRVSEKVLLILPKNLSFTPSGVVIDVGHSVKRLAAKLAKLPDVEQLAMNLDIPFPFPAVPDQNASAEDTAKARTQVQEVLDSLPFSFGDGCLACPLFEACRDEAEAQRLTVRLGSAVAGVCGDVSSVDDAVALGRGTRAAVTGAEAALANILARAEAAELHARSGAA